MASTASYETAEQSVAGRSMQDDVFTVPHDTPPPTFDKPLPIPPVEDSEERLSGPSNWSAATLPIPSDPAFEAIAPNLMPSPVAAPLRLKTKVQWGKKNISILLPLDEDRGKEGKAPKPLTEKDVSTMLTDWEQLGYNVHGFNLDVVNPSHDAASQGQSRDMWPNSIEIGQQKDTGKFKVSIPDRRHWDAYVNELKEAKLRALGVSLGDIDPLPTPSPALPLSLQTSAQYPAMPFQPPLAPSSAASSHGTQPSKLFSPPLGPGAGAATGQSSFVGSNASPASMHAQMIGKLNNPRQSISFPGGEHPFGSPYGNSQQQSPLPWSPQQMVYQGVHRGGSPSVHNFGAFASQNSPLTQDGYFPNEIAAMATHNQRQQQFSNQIPFQHQFTQSISTQSPRLQEVSLGGEKSPSKTPEASHSTRPTHRMNLSDSLQKEIEDAEYSLQKEIEDAEYHLEGQIERQLEHDDYSPHSEKGQGWVPNETQPPHLRTNIPSSFAGLSASKYADDEGPVLHHPQPHSRGHSLSQRPYDGEKSASPALATLQSAKLGLSDRSASPSALGASQLLGNNTHQRTESIATNPWADTEPAFAAEKAPGKRVHVSKASLSKLNVAAPEFKFNPSSTFTPGKFTFPPNNPQPAVSTFNTSFVPISPASPAVQFGGSKINANAPFANCESEFSFSASGPTFRPDAPEFTPLAPYLSDSAGSSTEVSANLRSSIFGRISLNLSDVGKPSKKSKAIPIIRPVSSRKSRAEDMDDGVEGEDGRITQGEGRFKRSKPSDPDVNSVPLFSQPSMPLQETSREQSPPKEQAAAMSKSVDKENAAPPHDDQDGLRIAPVPTAQTSQGQTIRRFEDSPDYEGNEWAPYEWQQQKDAADFSMAVAHSVRDPPFKVFEQSGPSEVVDTHASPVNLKTHKKNSLSALAKPFQFRTDRSEPVNEAEEKSALSPPTTPVAAESVRAASVNVAPSRGLASSKYAEPSPSPPAQQVEGSQAIETDEPEVSDLEERRSQQQQSPPVSDDNVDAYASPREPTIEEIDDILRHINEADSAMAATRRPTETPQWHVSPEPTLQMPNAQPSPIRLQPQTVMRSDAPSPSPRRFQLHPGSRIGQSVFSRVHDDPFVSRSPVAMSFEASPIHHLNGDESVEPSDWDSLLEEEDELKFIAQTHFLDRHINDIVGGILATQLHPMEQVLETIQLSLETLRPPSRDRISSSIEFQESDADDEDDEEGHHRSLSPRKDRKLDQFRNIITEALAMHSPLSRETSQPRENPQETTAILAAIKDLQDQFGQSMHLDSRGDDLRNIIEDAIERRMPVSPDPVIDEVSNIKMAQLETKVAEMAEKVKLADEKAEQETTNRRAAEDRLSEIQRIFQTSSEEEVRLRESLDERDEKVKYLEDARVKNAIRVGLLEASSQSSQKDHSELTNRISVLEKNLVEAHEQGRQWEFEAHKSYEIVNTSKRDAERANAEATGLRRTVESLKLQTQESLRVRETFRLKLGSLQDGMAKAAEEVSEENAQRAKKEQALLARHEVLDARLQAEARTRERLEREIERLETGEREGIRAVNDSKKLDILVINLENELNEAERNVLRYKREFEEARESGLSEVQRTRNYMQAEIESANNQVNIVRQDVEDQLLRVRAELDQVRLDADTSRERHDMLLEEATQSKEKQRSEMLSRHANVLEDVQTHHDRQLDNVVEDAQRSEQHLLERLSLSSAKTEHLQDRVTYLEEKLEVAKFAALAAAQAARTIKDSAPVPAATMELPERERVSPQALRESIMVLQEQLQNREQSIESLEQQLAGVDLDTPTKILKRDDEIMWLRELLAVRVGDVQDIINTISGETFDPETVKAAAIRLQANLQMEVQERERAMNGGSAINLPNIAASIREAATPRVAQVVGPMAAAWGNWRKTREGLQGFVDRSANSTPSKSNQAAMMASGAQSFLSGLMSPPAVSLGQTPPPRQAQRSAFNSTGRRLTAAQMARERASPRKEIAKGKARAAPSESDVPPSTPPMMRRSSYDADARAEDYSDAGFYDDDESTVDEGMFGASLGR